MHNLISHNLILHVNHHHEFINVSYQSLKHNTEREGGSLSYNKYFTTAFTQTQVHTKKNRELSTLRETAGDQQIQTKLILHCYPNIKHFN